MSQPNLVGYAYGSFTRPADTTQYSDGDAVSNSTTAPAAIEILGINDPLYGGGIAHTFKLTTNDTDVVSASFRLWLYNTAPTTLTNDNAAMTLNVYEERTNLIGYVDFSTFIAGADGKVSFGSPIFTNLMGVQAATSKSIYGLLQAKGTYTPASGEIFHIMIGAVR